MGIRSFFGLNCEAAANACNKTLYNEAGLTDRLRLKFHLLLCPPCKDLSNKNQRLNHLIKKADIKSCTEEEKVAYKRRMKEGSSNTFK